MTAREGEPLDLPGRQGASFVTRRVVVPGGSSIPLDEVVWRDALVIVERGWIELETRSGLRRAFGAGDVLWFTDLNLRAVHNPAPGTALLTAISRQTAE